MSNQIWNIEENKLAHLAKASHSLSPLRALEPKGRKPKNMDPGLAGACAVLEKPRVELGLLLSPPHALSVLWFYSNGDAENWVGHQHPPFAEEHKVVATARKELFEHISDCLWTDIPTESTGLSLELPKADFLTLIGAIDFAREVKLNSLVARVPNIFVPITVADVISTLTLSYRVPDHRWLAGLCLSTTPGHLSLTNAECEKGLSNLQRMGLLDALEGGLQLSKLGLELLLHLAVPSRHVCLHGRIQKATSVEERHLLLLRTSDSLWKLEFFDDSIRIESLGTEELLVELKDVTSDWLGQSEEEKSQPKPKTRTGQKDPSKSKKGGTKKKAKSAVSSCSCGRDLDADTKFCPSCGKPVNDVSEEREKFCRKCGAERLEDADFCAKCGSKF